MNIKRWSIWRANLDPIVGSEQGKSRPVLIISEDQINNLLSIVNVLPITTRKKGRTVYPNEVLIQKEKFGLVNESIILCHQIRTIDKQRLSIFYGEILDNEIKDLVVEALSFQLGLEK